MQHVDLTPDSNGNFFATFPDRGTPSEEDIKRQLYEVLKDKGYTLVTLGAAISWPTYPNVDGLKYWFDNGRPVPGAKIPLTFVNSILALLRPGAPALTNPGGPDDVACSREALVQALGLSGGSQYGLSADLS
jgi:hypothetical protein